MRLKIKRVSLLFVLMCFSSISLFAQNSPLLVLENDFLKVEINKKTGAIDGVYNKQTNWQLIRQPKLSMGLQLLIPLEGQRNHKALSKDQVVSKVEQINTQECRLVWNQIQSQKIKNLNIKVSSSITLKEAAITFDLTIDNNSRYRIDEVSYPCFGGVRPPANTQTFRTRTINMAGGFQNADMLSPFPQARGYWGVDYPSFMNEFPDVRCMMPFELIEADNQGIYFGAWDNSSDNIYFLHEFAPGFLDSKHNLIPKSDELSGKPAGYVFTMVRTPFLEPGKKIELAPAVFKMYKGDWHQGVQSYMDWRLSWFKPKPQPAWANSVDSWQNVLMLDPVGTITYKYQDLIDLAKEAKKNGIKTLQIIGWNKGGLDRGAPYFDTDPRLGTREQFKEVIQKIENSGIRVLLFCKFSWADATTPEFAEEIKKFTVKNFYGVNDMTGYYGYQTITGGGTAGTPLCLLSAGFRKFATQQLENIMELGASGIQYDQLAPGGNCYDTTHNHAWGESVAKGALLLAEDFYAAARKNKKEFILTGEGPSDQMSGYYPISYIRTSDYYYWIQKHVPVWKYINPNMNFVTAVIGSDDREMINQCLAYGYIIGYEPYNFKGKLSDVPLTVQYGRQAQMLRYKLRDYLAEGKFLDTQGAIVEPLSKNSSNFYYSVFERKADGKKAIVVVNDDKEKSLSVAIALKNKKAQFTINNAENTHYRKYENNAVIPARSLIVLVEE